MLKSYYDKLKQKLTLKNYMNLIDNYLWFSSNVSVLCLAKIKYDKGYSVTFS